LDVDGTGSGSCPVTGFGIVAVQSLGFATRVLAWSGRWTKVSFSNL